MKPVISAAAFVAGFAAGEGTFTRSGARRFRFAVGLGAIDGDMCHRLHQFFGVGHVHTSPRRKPQNDDETTYCVGSLGDLVNVIVPFMDEHLPESYKRVQYEVWREALLEYWENTVRRPRPCAIVGCDRVRKVKELCRQHYFELYRH